MIAKTWITLLVLLLAASAHLHAEDRFVTKLSLQTGETVTVAEGDFEARSIGSFSVRLYDVAKPPNETTFYTSGLIYPRDGAIERVALANIDGDKQQAIIVIARSVGTGGYLSAYAFTTSKGKLAFRGAVEDLAPDADPLLALRQSIKRQK